MLPTKKPQGFLPKQKQEARRLGRNAILTGLGSTALYWTLGSIPILGPLAGLTGLGLTAYQTWLWLQYRGKWGLRF